MSEPATHDYGPGKRGWGHDYAIHAVAGEGAVLHASGWGHGIDTGDYLLIESQQPTRDGRTRYRVAEIKYYANPADMWSARLEFAPRSRPPADEAQP